jgi:hypothetical protein
MNNVPNPQGGNPAVMCNATAIVPANDWYKVDTDTFTDVYLNNWEELRSTTGPQVCDPYPSSTSSSSKRARRPNG